MKSHPLLHHFIFAAAVVLLPPLPLRAQGVFEKNQDIGAVKNAGKATYDETKQSYAVSGSGQNMWFVTDAFHFVWKKVSGDVTLSADISFPAPGKEPHRKAVLMVRQTLDPDSAYADAVLHGDGLTSLQYRESKGARTYEIQANATGPQRLRIEKRGKYVSMSIAAAGEELRPAGGSFRLELQEPFYIGLGVCSHNDDVLETAVFSNVQLAHLPAVTAQADSKPKVICTLEEFLAKRAAELKTVPVFGSEYTLDGGVTKEMRLAMNEKLGSGFGYVE